MEEQVAARLRVTNGVLWVGKDEEAHPARVVEVLKKAAATEPEADLLAEEAEEMQAMAGVVRCGLVVVVHAVKQTETLTRATMKPTLPETVYPEKYCGD